MNSTMLVITLVAAVVFVAFGIQVTARQIQRFPFDTRRPGALIDISRESTWVVNPVELEQLNSIVTESFSSEAVARTKLWPLLDELAHDAPLSIRPTTGSAGSRTGARRARSRQLDERLDELERAWGLSDP